MTALVSTTVHTGSVSACGIAAGERILNMTGIDLVQYLKHAGTTVAHGALSADPGSLTLEQQALFDTIANRTGEKNYPGNNCA